MARTTRISVGNTFEMRPVDPQRSARYHRGHLETDWQSELIMSFQDQDQVYLQKVERSDRFRFAYDATDNDRTSSSLKIINCTGTAVLTIAETDTADIPGNVTGDGSQLHSYVYRRADLTALAEGKYYVLLTVQYDGSHSEQFISHPIWLKDVHADTILLEYRHSINTKGLWFEQLPIRFPFRLEGYIGAVTAKNTATVYEEQEGDYEQLDSVAYREFPLCIGETGEGISEWVYNKLNHILDFDTVYIDGKQYRRATSAALEKQADPAGPLFACTVNIREPQNSIGVDSGSPVIDLYTSPGFPYAVYGLQLAAGSSVVNLIPFLSTSVITLAAVIHDSTEEAAFIGALNAELASMELFGTVVITGGVIQYINAQDEAYTVGVVTIYTSYFGFTFSCPGSGFNTLSFALEGAISVIEYGDGTLGRVNFPASYGPITVSKAYPNTIANYSVRIWGPVQSFIMSHANTSVLIGNVPQGFRKLMLDSFGHSSNVFSLASLAGAQGTLNTVSLTNSGLTNITGIPTVYYPYLGNVDFSGNQISAAAVTVIMRNIYYNATNTGAGPTLSGGNFSIVSQSPAVTLTPAGIIYKNWLKAIGWGVYY